MYKFTRADETPFDSFRPIETVFDGVSLDRELSDSMGEFRTLRVDGRSLANYSIETSEMIGKDGGLMLGRSLQIRIITVTYRLKDSTNAGFRRRYERLNMLLRNEERKLLFTDEEFYFKATFSSGDIPEESSNDVTGSLTFICHDPYKYSNPITQRNVSTVQTLSLYPARPIITITPGVEENEIILENKTTGKVIHLRSENPFVAAPIVIDTTLWTVTQEGSDRIVDLMIRSDLEDFTVSDGDKLEMNIPGVIDLMLEGVSL